MKSASDVFDLERFWEDVNNYIIRQDWSELHFCHLLEIDASQFRYARKWKRSISLRWACMMSKVCDLDLNVYVKELTW